jgi:uncharacterized protein YbjT (DUF2867 family)
MKRKGDTRGRSGPRIVVTGDAGFEGSHFLRHWLATHGGKVPNADARVVGSFAHREITVTGHDSVGGRYV